MKKLIVTALATATLAMGGVAHGAANCTPVGQEPRQGYPPCETVPPSVLPPTTPPLIPETGNDPSSSLFIGGTLAAVGGALVVVARSRRRSAEA